jgi:hypothetical protein
MKYLLDATKERLEKAPRVEGKNYERLYPAETAEAIFVYWDVEWIAQPDAAMRLVETPAIRRSGRIAGSQFRFSRAVQAILALLGRSRLSESKIASRSAILEAQLMHG